MSLNDSAREKYRWLARTLEKWSDCITPVIRVDEDKRFEYRNKVSLSACYTSSGWNFGMWSRNDFIAIPDCPVHSARVRQIIYLLREKLPPYEVFPVHFLVIAEKQITLVLKSKLKPDLIWFDSELERKFSETGAEALWLHLNPSAGHRMFEKTPWIHLWGKELSVDYNGFYYGPTSFHQLISELYQQSLWESFAFLKPDKISLVVDLYCGIGHSIKWWAGSGAHVLGIESSAEAVSCASKNVPKAIVLRGQCHTRIAQINKIVTERGLDVKNRILYVNPPRTGLGEKVIQWILDDYFPDRIAYLSCSTGTLSCDLDKLTEKYYKVQKIIPYDFFPGTHHVETLVLIERIDLL